MNIFRSSVKNPVTTSLVFAALVVFGVFSLLNTSIALYPDIDANTVMVVSSYHGAGASDVESNLTKLLENTLNGVPNLKNLKSSSREDVSVVSLEFAFGTDMESAVNDIRDKLDMINSSLPEGAGKPVIFKFSTEDIPIMIFSAKAKESLPSLNKILEDKVATPLARIKGVGTIHVSGAPSREIKVLCNPDKLQAYGLSVQSVSSVIAAENRNIPCGSIDIGSSSFSLRVNNEFKRPSELLDIVVASVNGQNVYLRDIAEVSDGAPEKEQEAYTDGERAGLISVVKQSGANTVRVIQSVKKMMEQIKPSLPSDVEIITVMDNSNTIKNSINSLKETILITLLVVMLVVYVFLGRWKATLIIVISIPISLLASLMYLFATGNTLNIVSMSALSIAIGMVVDDAIVVIENITTHIEKGESPKEAAVIASREVGISVIASTLTMLAVFMPLTLVSGMAGIMFKQLGWIVSFIMIVSTAAALSLVPMMSAYMLKPKKDQQSKLYDLIFNPIDKGLEHISKLYSMLISWSLSHKAIVLLSSFVIFVFTIVFIAPKIRTEYFPHSDQGELTVSVELPSSASQSVTGEFANVLYNKIKKEIPEIKIFNISYGKVDSDNLWRTLMGSGSYKIDMNISLGSSVSRSRSIGEISDEIRSILRSYPLTAKFNITEGVGNVGGAPSLQLDLFGYNFEKTGKTAEMLKEKMLASGAFSQVILSRESYSPEFRIEFDRTKLALNGLNSSSVASALSASVNGSVLSYYREEGDEYKIRVRLAPEYRKNLEDIYNMFVYTPAGKPVKISELGTIVKSQVPPAIERKNRERVITVSGIIAQGYALSQAVDAAKNSIKATDIPSDVSVDITGDYKEQQEMFMNLGILMLLITILVYMVMASQFESLLGPFVIMFSIPFAFVGVFLGLWITNTPLGVMSMIGIIILIGIVVKNGIVLIDYTLLLRERGIGLREATISAAKSRLRPILMTTLTTVLGMVPMAVGIGEGSEMWRSLGMTVCWGLSVSTVVTLILIPTIYCVFKRKEE